MENQPVEIGRNPENWLLGKDSKHEPLALPEFRTVESLFELEQLRDRRQRNIDPKAQQ